MKLIAETDEELQKETEAVRTFSDDIHVEFPLDKCAELVFKKGKLLHFRNLILDINREIHELEK